MELNLLDWILEADAFGTGTDTQTGIPGNVPITQPNTGAMAPSAAPGGDPNAANMPPADNLPNDNQQQLPDYANDPQQPDVPEDQMETDELDFEKFKKRFLVDSVKGNVQELKDLILKVRDYDLEPYQRKFVEDNLQILFLRENSNIDKVTKDIRKTLKEDLDHNNPATSLVDHMTHSLESQPSLNSIYVKLSGYHGLKGELHRQFIASLTGAVQVGAGGLNEDLILNEREFSIKISTRMANRWGDISIGPWRLQEEDPERFLKPIELKKLEDGSPEERVSLKHRVIIESICKVFEERAFIINVVADDGTINYLGFDISSSIKSAFLEGKLIVRTTLADNVEIFIDEDGSIVQIPDIKILYVKEEGEVGEDGKKIKKHIEFIEKKNGNLFLVAPIETIKEASTAFQGLNLKEVPYSGNPSDLNVLRRCISSTPELLLRNC